MRHILVEQLKNARRSLHSMYGFVGQPAAGL